MTGQLTLEYEYDGSIEIQDANLTGQLTLDANQMGKYKSRTGKFKFETRK